MTGHYFTQRVRESLARARDQAAEMHYEYVGTEHILLALVDDQDSIAVALLRQQKVTPEAVRAEVRRQAKPGTADADTVTDFLPYSARSKRVLEQAMHEAREMGDAYIDTGHLLLGLVREKRDVGAAVLNTLGYSRDAARDGLRTLHAAGQEDPGGTAPPALEELSGDGAAKLLERIARAPRFAPVFAAHGISVDKLLDDLRRVKPS